MRFEIPVTDGTRLISDSTEQILIKYCLMSVKFDSHLYLFSITATLYVS